MKPHFGPILSEEQLAAYLDGMLSADESSFVENAIDNDPELQEIQEALDEVDSSYIAYDATEEIPVECMSDDFVLPTIDTMYGEDGFNNVEDSFTDDNGQAADEIVFNDEYHAMEDVEDTIDDNDSFGYQDFLS